MHCLDPMCKLGLYLHLPWFGANILVKESRRGVSAGRSIGSRSGGEEVFRHGWCAWFFGGCFLSVQVLWVRWGRCHCFCVDLFLVKREIFAGGGLAS